jgi:hypothetical protein
MVRSSGRISGKRQQWSGTGAARRPVASMIKEVHLVVMRWAMAPITEGTRATALMGNFLLDL